MTATAMMIDATRWTDGENRSTRNSTRMNPSSLLSSA